MKVPVQIEDSPAVKPSELHPTSDLAWNGVVKLPGYQLPIRTQCHVLSPLSIYGIAVASLADFVAARRASASSIASS